MSANEKWTAGPWEVDTVKSEGDYGDGGPDSKTGYDAYAVFDSRGYALFDSLNRDSRVSEIHEDGPDEDGRGAAWDEPARRDLTLAAAAPELAAALYAEDALIVSAQSILTRYLIPDGLTMERAIAELLTLLDGPQQRRAQNAARAALRKARGEP